MSRQIAEAEIHGILRGGIVQDGLFIYHDGHRRWEIPVEQVRELRVLQEVNDG